MSTLDSRKARAAEGESRKSAAHTRLEARRDWLIRRALLLRLLTAGTATADDVAERIGPGDSGIDHRWLGTVPGPLDLAGIIRRAGSTTSCRPIRHASVISTWELADRNAALTWLARHPELPDPEPGDGDGATSPTPSSPPSPAPLAAALTQPTLF